MISDLDSKLINEGYAVDGPAIAHDKDYHRVFSYSGKILQDLLAGGRAEVVHDEQWSKYPEVGKCLTPAGLEADCYAVALFKPAGKWAVGLAPGWKQREAAARLALAVALFQDSPNQLQVLKDFQDFTWFVGELGMCD